MARFANLESVKTSYRPRHLSREMSDDNGQELIISPLPPPLPPPPAVRKSFKNKRLLPLSAQRRPLPEAQTFVIIFAYVGALIQGVFLLYRFTQYPTTTTVLIERPQSTELPSISLCFFYGLPEQKKIFLNGSIEVYPLTLAEINKKLPKIDEWIINCKVLNTSYQLQNCLDFYNYTVEYVSLYSKCYSYFESLPKQVYYDRKLVVGKWMLDVTFNTSVIQTRRIGIYITHTYAELEESLGNPSFLQFDTEINNQAVATFKRTAVHRLEPPYDTDCLSYEQYYCNHPKTCMRHCIMNVSFDRYQSWFSRSYVKMRPEFNVGFFTNRSEKEMYAECSLRYNKPPCRDYHYLAIMTSEFKSEIQANGTFKLSVAYPTAPKIEVQFYPQVKFIDTVVFFGGMFYLWTGISLFMIISWLIRNFVQIMSHLFGLIFQKKSNQLENNLHIHGTPKISVISKGWIENDEVPAKPVRLNQFTSHGLATFRSPEI